MKILQSNPSVQFLLDIFLKILVKLDFKFEFCRKKSDTTKINRGGLFISAIFDTKCIRNILTIV